MTALKIKGLQIKRISSSEQFDQQLLEKNGTTVVQSEANGGLKGLLGLIQQFVAVGGDFV